MFKVNWVALIGVTFTVLYLLFFATLAWLGMICVTNLSANEWGDFIAGMFGPIATLWLILGFFQQGRELRLSVEALKLQAEELKQSVDQQKAMVKVAEKQFEMDIEVREEQIRKRISEELPYFVLARGIGKRYAKGVKEKLSLRNMGADALNAVVLIPQSEVFGLKETSKETVPTGETMDIEFASSRWFGADDNFVLEITAENIRGIKRNQKFSFGSACKELECHPERE